MFLQKLWKRANISGYMYKFHDITPISGQISGISGQRPGLNMSSDVVITWPTPSMMYPRHSDMPRMNCSTMKRKRHFYIDQTSVPLQRLLLWNAKKAVENSNSTASLEFLNHLSDRHVENVLGKFQECGRGRSPRLHRSRNRNIVRLTENSSSMSRSVNDVGHMINSRSIFSSSCSSRTFPCCLLLASTTCMTTHAHVEYHPQWQQFPPAAEFRADPRNSLISAEFLHFLENFFRNSVLVGDYFYFSIQIQVWKSFWQNWLHQQSANSTATQKKCFTRRRMTNDCWRFGTQGANSLFDLT